MSQTQPKFSPRTRGSSHCGGVATHEADVFPAHAGIVPMARREPGTHESFPRARGDRPSDAFLFEHLVRFSPRTRGSSPHTRGAGRSRRVFPAHAGIVPSMPGGRCFTSSFPRARGDRPARGRHLPCVRKFPRARGDRPTPTQRHRTARWFSPRTRGSFSSKGQKAKRTTNKSRHPTGNKTYERTLLE